MKKLMPWLLVGGAGMALWYFNKPDKRKVLSEKGGINSATVAMLSSSEVDQTYSYLVDYFLKGLKQSAPAALTAAVAAISEKYKFWT